MFEENQTFSARNGNTSQKHSSPKTLIPTSPNSQSENGLELGPSRSRVNPRARGKSVNARAWMYQLLIITKNTVKNDE